MDALLMAVESWQGTLGGLLVAVGVALLWRGLGGGKEGRRGLLRTRDGLLGRIEGFRLTVGGLVLIGSGAAFVSDARWLLFLSVGIGAVEILESSTLIAVWK